MKRLCLTTLLASGTLLALFPLRTHAGSEFTDFRIPAHHWSSWNAVEDASLSRSRADQAGLGSSASGRLFVNLESRALWGYDSDRLSHQFSLSGRTAGIRSHATQTLDGTPSLRPRSQTTGVHTSTESISLSASVTSYPVPWPLGLGAAVTFQSALTQIWSSSGSVTDAPPLQTRQSSDSHEDQHQHFLIAGGQLFLGHVRDATPVYEARILEARLARTGRLQHALTTTARERVAGLFAIAPHYKNAHDRPGRAFWAEVERVLREDDAIAAGTIDDAVSMLMLLEPVGPSGLMSRQAGFATGPEVGASSAREYYDADGSSASSLCLSGVLQGESRSSSSFVEHRRRDGVFVAWNTGYHRPFGLRWQADANNRLEYTDAGQSLRMNTFASVQWLVADRWRASLRTSQFALANDSRGSRKFTTWSVGTGASVEYFLEDAWTLALVWDDAQQHDTRQYRSQESVRLGMSYRISGRLAAPGLMAPTRLSPPSD